MTKHVFAEGFLIPKKSPYNLSAYWERLKKAYNERNLAKSLNDLNEASDEEEPAEENDNVANRVHCWVLIKKGQRGLPSDIYIEPTTGRIYEQK